MAKETTYQRLKRENAELKDDIYTLVVLTNSKKTEDIIKVFGVNCRWKIKFDLERIVWSGNTSLKTNG